MCFSGKLACRLTQVIDMALANFSHQTRIFGASFGNQHFCTRSLCSCNPAAGSCDGLETPPSRAKTRFLFCPLDACARFFLAFFPAICYRARVSAGTLCWTTFFFGRRLALHVGCAAFAHLLLRVLFTVAD